MRVETFFSDQKSRGFQIDRSHLSDPQQVSGECPPRLSGIGGVYSAHEGIASADRRFGRGKTTVARRVEAKNLPNVVVRYFDTIGGPSFEQMVREAGSLEAWQRAKTIEWIGTLSRAYAGDEAVLFDGQTRAPPFRACRW